MNNIVILDIETTGDNYLLDEICQMSYIILDKNLRILKAKNFFFMVDYIHFKSNKNKLNINSLRFLSNNKTFKDRYKEIFNDLNDNLIVCHKCEHDISFLKSEFMRVNNKNNFVYEEFCTMKYYTNILKLPSEKFGYKYPKLIEILPYLNIKRGNIHQKSKELFNLSDEEINLHDSRVDVTMTYLIAIKTESLIDEYNNLINKKINTKHKLVNEDKVLANKVAIDKIKDDIDINLSVDNTFRDLTNTIDTTKKLKKIKIPKEIVIVGVSILIPMIILILLFITLSMI